MAGLAEDRLPSCSLGALVCAKQRELKRAALNSSLGAESLRGVPGRTHCMMALGCLSDSTGVVTLGEAYPWTPPEPAYGIYL